VLGDSRPDQQQNLQASEAPSNRLGVSRSPEAARSSNPLPEVPDEVVVQHLAAASERETPSQFVGSPAGDAGSPARYYQLTHDYLVPSLRDWLTRKQKQTRRGRAELRLAERAAQWHAKPENRHLPAWWEWVNIRLFTRQKDWTLSQRKMMGKATRYHAGRGSVIALALAVAVLTGLAIYYHIEEQRQAANAAALVQRLRDAQIGTVPSIITEMAVYHKWTEPLVREALQGEDLTQDQELHLRLALLPNDPDQVDYLYEQLLLATPQQLPIMRSALRPHKDNLIERLWKDLLVGRPPIETNALPLASTLVDYAPSDPRWEKAAPTVALQLANRPLLLDEVLWADYLFPARTHLLPHLVTLYREKQDSGLLEVQNLTALVSVFAQDQPRLLADFLLGANDKEFAVLLRSLQPNAAGGIPVLLAELDKKLPANAGEKARLQLAKRKANAAVALLRLGRPERAWKVLQHSADPTARSYLIHRLGPFGADAKMLVQRLDAEPDITIRRALLLSLGGFGDRELSPGQRRTLLPKVKEIYCIAADPGLHAAGEWLLRHWGQQAWLAETNDAWAKDKDGRAEKLERLAKAMALERPGGLSALVAPPSARKKPLPPPAWYVNDQGQTMVILPGPVEFTMGSPATEKGRQKVEQQHQRWIGRNSALAAKPVTVAEFRRFLRGEWLNTDYMPTDDCPVTAMTWHEAAAYCNWLSKQEGIHEEQWCYVTNTFGQVIGVKENYLHLTGYRLPTEAEWEYACRAGAVTGRYCGAGQELLDKYGWYQKNSQDRAWPPGKLKPNDLGLFDMHGNVFCWCQNAFQDYPVAGPDQVVDDNEDLQSRNMQANRVLRGGTFDLSAGYVRSALRGRNAPGTRLISVGFRPARTFTAY
jgi:formylglycine-generating enzyme required for sulfatase activity